MPDRYDQSLYFRVEEEEEEEGGHKGGDADVDVDELILGRVEPWGTYVDRSDRHFITGPQQTSETQRDETRRDETFRASLGKVCMMASDGWRGPRHSWQPWTVLSARHRFRSFVPLFFFLFIPSVFPLRFPSPPLPFLFFGLRCHPLWGFTYPPTPQPLSLRQVPDGISSRVRCREKTMEMIHIGFDTVQPCHLRIPPTP